MLFSMSAFFCSIGLMPSQPDLVVALSLDQMRTILRRTIDGANDATIVALYKQCEWAVNPALVSDVQALSAVSDSGWSAASDEAAEMVELIVSADGQITGMVDPDYQGNTNPTGADLERAGHRLMTDDDVRDREAALAVMPEGGADALSRAAALDALPYPALVLALAEMERDNWSDESR